MHTLTIHTSEDLADRLSVLGLGAYSRLVVEGPVQLAHAQQIARARIADIEELCLERGDDDPDAIDDAVSAALLGGAWRSLRAIDLTLNPCGPETLRALSQLPALESVDLPLTSTGDHIATLVGAPVARWLTRLDLRNCGVGDAGMQALARAELVRLRVLRVSTTSASLQSVAELAASPHLAGLDELAYSWPRDGAAVVAALAGERSRLGLRRLSLSTLELDAGSVERLVAKMPALEQLWFGVCTLDAGAIAALGRLRCLRDVMLLRCSLDAAARAALAMLGSRVREG